MSLDTLHSAFLAFFTALAVKTEGKHEAYFEKPYLSIRGDKIIECPSGMIGATITYHHQKYCHFMPLKKAIGNIRKNAKNPQDLKLTAQDSETQKLSKLLLLMQFYESLSICDSSKLQMQAPVYSIKTSSCILYDFKSIIIFQLSNNSYDVNTHIKNHSLIPLRILFDATQKLSSSIQRFSVDDTLLQLDQKTNIEFDTLINFIELPSLAVQLSFWKELVTPHQNLETLWRFISNHHIQFTTVGFLLENVFDAIAPALGLTTIELSYRIVFRILWQTFGIRFFTEDYGIDLAAVSYQLVAAGGMGYALFTSAFTTLPACTNAINTVAPILCPTYRYMLRGLDIATNWHHVLTPTITWFANGGLARQCIRYSDNNASVDAQIEVVEEAIKACRDIKRATLKKTI